MLLIILISSPHVELLAHSELTSKFEASSLHAKNFGKLKDAGAEVQRAILRDGKIKGLES